VNNAISNGLAPASDNANRLNTLESIIQRGKLAYIEVGNALREVNGRNLFLIAGYDTFRAYCKERLGFSQASAYNYINAADVATTFQTSGIPEPSYYQAVALSPLEPEQQLQVAATTDLSKMSVRQLQRRINAEDGELTAHELDTAEPHPRPANPAVLRQYAAGTVGAVFEDSSEYGKMQRFELKKSSVTSNVAVSDGRLDIHIYGSSEKHARLVAEVYR
jgi:hypothetical protein